MFEDFSENTSESIPHHRWRVATVISVTLIIIGISSCVWAYINPQDPNYFLAIGTLLIGFGLLAFVGCKLGIWVSY